MQFLSEIVLVISNQTRATHSFDFEITKRMISDQSYTLYTSTKTTYYLLKTGTEMV